MSLSGAALETRSGVGVAGPRTNASLPSDSRPCPCPLRAPRLRSLLQTVSLVAFLVRFDSIRARIVSLSPSPLSSLVTPPTFPHPASRASLCLSCQSQKSISCVLLSYPYLIRASVVPQISYYYRTLQLLKRLSRRRLSSSCLRLCACLSVSVLVLLTMS